jgi:DNA invertase Pin-like site-specific DNA recombinase
MRALIEPPADIETTTIKWPPATGRGSGKDAWQALADELYLANRDLSAIIKDQERRIDELQAEVQLLRQQIETRKPRGGRARTPDEKVARIERALGNGRGIREIAKAMNVSPMTVSRIKKRVAARQAETT